MIDPPLNICFGKQLSTLLDFFIKYKFLLYILRLFDYCKNEIINMDLKALKPTNSLLINEFTFTTNRRTKRPGTTRDRIV